MKTLLKGTALVAAMLLPSVAMADWNGRYAGVSGGSLTASSYEISNSDSDDGQAPLSDTSTLGVHFGSTVQSGQFVYGGELDIVFAPDADISEDVTIEDPIVDLKFKAGYSVDKFLAYGVFGASFIGSTFGPNDINASGLNFGAGVDFMLTDNLVIGAEYLARRTSEEFLNADVEIEMDTVTVRASFKF